MTHCEPLDDSRYPIQRCAVTLDVLPSNGEDGRPLLKMMREIKRVLVPDGKVLLMERGWSPWLALVFGPLFLHFTPAKECNNNAIMKTVAANATGRGLAATATTPSKGNSVHKVG